MKVGPRPLEIFCGTGGVGKTTLAATRAFKLAQDGKKVLLVTIDPAKRLKDFIGLEEGPEGEVVTKEFQVSPNKYQLDVLLMSAEKAFIRLAKKSAHDEDTQRKLLENRILKILFRQYGGMNEIMSVLEIESLLSSGNYDHIVLDTPPGKHFLDFLYSTEKIDKFFNKNFIDVFNYLKGKKEEVTSKSVSSGIFGKIIKTGIQKLLSYLEKVTGKFFVDEFIESIEMIFLLKDAFLKCKNLQRYLKQDHYAHWFLVTSAEHSKVEQLLEIYHSAYKYLSGGGVAVINKCIDSELEIADKDVSSISDKAKRLIDSFRQRERKIKERLEEFFPEYLEFPDTERDSIENQLKKLIEVWDRLSIHA